MDFIRKSFRYPRTLTDQQNGSRGCRFDHVNLRLQRMRTDKDVERAELTGIGSAKRWREVCQIATGITSDRVIYQTCFLLPQAATRRTLGPSGSVDLQHPRLARLPPPSFTSARLCAKPFRHALTDNFDLPRNPLTSGQCPHIRALPCPGAMSTYRFLDSFISPSTTASQRCASIAIDLPCPAVAGLPFALAVITFGA